MTKKEEIIMTLLQELERTITTIMDVLNISETVAEKSDDKWIPADFFKPEPYKHVLVTYTDGSVGENWVVKTMHQRVNNYFWYKNEDEDILAWMPMPSAWEGWKQP